jgi:cell division protein FtsQ
MWDNPRLLNAAANALLALAFVLAAWAGIKLVAESPLFPLRSIRLEGDLEQVRRADIAAALQERLPRAQTFFTMDIAVVRALMETVPWVRRAEVRRVWPDTLLVRVEEHRPLARWGQSGDPRGEQRLVNTHGEVFTAAYADAASLPQFSGPLGTALEVARRYARYSALLQPLDLRLQAVMLSPRYSWQLRLSNGLTLQLGREVHDKDRERIEERLARFVAVYPRTLAPLAAGRRLDYVDLRYASGFALRVPGLKDGIPPIKPQQERKTPA